LRSGTLALDPIGTDTSHLRYVFPGGFTITKPATIDVAPDVTVVIPSGQTLTVDGTLNTSDGDRVLLDPEDQQPAQIVVAGTLSAAESSFIAGGGDGSALVVYSGGHFQAVNCVFALSTINVGTGANAAMSGNRLGDSTASTKLVIDSNATIAIEGN